MLYSSKLLDRSLVQYSKSYQSIWHAPQGDFKFTGFSYSKTPNVIIPFSLDQENANAQQLRVVGDVKIPWLIEHRLGLCATDSTPLRTVLTKTIPYSPRPAVDIFDPVCRFGWCSFQVEWGMRALDESVLEVVNIIPLLRFVKLRCEFEAADVPRDN